MTNLHRVRGNGCVLHFPLSFDHPELVRGGQGYVVDLDAPLEAEWCKGQEYKLEPAPADAKPNAIIHPVARKLLLAEATRAAAAPAKGAKAKPTDDLEVVRPARAGVA